MSASATPQLEKAQIKIISQLDDAVVLREAARRRVRLRQELGPYATMIKLRPCPFCHNTFSTRKLREHTPQCPERDRIWRDEHSELSTDELSERLYRAASKRKARSVDELCRSAEVPCTQKAKLALQQLVKLNKLAEKDSKFLRAA